MHTNTQTDINDITILLCCPCAW